MRRAVERAQRAEKRAPRGAGLRLFRRMVACNIAAGMEYRASFLTQVVGMMFNNSVFILFWMILYERLGTTIKGYAFGDVMFLWALSAAGYGISAVFLGNASSLSRTIYTGELDVYLLQPKPLLPSFLASRMSIPGWGDLAYGVILFAVTQSLSPGRIALFLAFSILMAAVLAAIRVLYHSLTFFFGNAEDFAGTASEVVLSFMLYPGSIFEGPVNLLLHSLIPAALIAYIPAELFRAFDAGRMALLVAADLLIVLAAWVLFSLGLRKYESGNRIGTRL
jgi:ABC-2 type transport system permease protein